LHIFDWEQGDKSSVWATSAYHLLCIDAATEIFTKYALPVSFDKTVMRLMTDKKKYVWLFNQKNQLLCFDMQEKKISAVAVRSFDNPSLQLKENPRIIFNDKSGTPCMLIHDGLYKYDSDAKTFVQFSRSILSNDAEKKFQGDPGISGNYIFTGINNRELLRIDLHNGAEKFYPLNRNGTHETEPGFVFNGVYPSNDGSLWISTTSAGVFHFYPSSETWDQFIYDHANQNSLLSNSVDLIFEDENNVTWLNSPGRGIVKAEPLKPVLSSFVPARNKRSLQGTLGENIRTITAFDEEHLMIGTLRGLFLFNRPSMEFTEMPSPAGGKPILTSMAISHIITDPSGNFWIAEWGSPFIHYVNYKNKIYAVLVPDSSTMKLFLTIRVLFRDSHGFLWAGTDGNIIYRANLDSSDLFHPEKIIFERFPKAASKTDTLNIAKCFSITENAERNIYFGTESGLYEYDYISEKFKRYSHHPGHQSLSDNNVRSLCIDHPGTFWLGTASGGLNRFDKKNQTFSFFTMENGLPDNSVFSILEDNKGFLWLGTNKGLCRFNPRNKSCRNYSMKDGIQNYEYNTNAAYKTSTGELAFGGRTGFNFFNPDSIEIISDAPRIVITRLNVFDKEMHCDTNEIKLKHNENSLSFQFAALSFFRNKENQYAYKLEGLENEWIYCGDRRFTNYASLPPGNYIFRVKASNCYGVWNEAGTLVKLFIGTPWWKTWWFRMVIALVITAMIFILFRYRLQQKLKLQSVRNRIARDLHDEIGSNLSSIILFSEVAKQKSKDSEPSVFPLLKKISDYTQTSQEAINDIVWMINSRNDRFENIIIRMRAIAAEMFEAKQINFILNFDEKLNHLKMGMDERKNFYLIYKEAINNIVKYAACNNVNINLTCRHSSIYLHIKDDGIGFDIKNKSKGNGLINMQKRAEMLEGILNVSAEPGKGTTIELKFAI
ncbi:MAG TPA: two-component regulator propeller domain-containing protein, partial [Bacteroidia bacterium]|nr:two-component regulator propeller domain-containing protein [Bacteroidia bacterium]